MKFKALEVKKSNFSKKFRFFIFSSSDVQSLSGVSTSIKSTVADFGQMPLTRGWSGNWRTLVRRGIPVPRDTGARKSSRSTCAFAWLSSVFLLAEVGRFAVFCCTRQFGRDTGQRLGLEHGTLEHVGRPTSGHCTGRRQASP